MREILMAGGLALFFSLFGTPLLIMVLVRRGYGQFFRDDGPSSHHTKRGTPTMGGTLIIVSTVLALLFWGSTLNVFSMIGLVMLMGLVTKNAILLVDFANQERARGTELLEALRRAGHTRFRPILMTSATSILGALPLALASGAGAESRQAIGIAVVVVIGLIVLIAIILISLVAPPPLQYNI